MQPAQINIHETKNGWYVETSQGAEGPLATRQEANAFVELLNKVDAARQEIVSLAE